MSVEDAERLTNKEIVEALGGLPEAEMPCSVMGQKAPEDALRNYRGLGPGPVVDGKMGCRCFGVSDSHIERVVTENGLVTVEAVTNFTKAGGGCKKCHERIQEVITDTLATSVQGEAKATELNDKKRFQLVDKVVYINGQPLDEPYVRHTRADMMPVRDNFGPYTVPEGCYFMLGDNREGSHDSRWWGPVKREKIVGKALFIYWSWGSVTDIRFGRIGSVFHHQDYN